MGWGGCCIKVDIGCADGVEIGERGFVYRTNGLDAVYTYHSSPKFDRNSCLDIAILLVDFPPPCWYRDLLTPCHRLRM